MVTTQMERSTYVLGLPVAEAARVVSRLVEHSGLSSRQVDCHALRQGETLLGMVLIFEKYYLRIGSRLTMTVVLEAQAEGTSVFWSVSGGTGIFGKSGDSKNAADAHSEALRESLFPYLA